MPIIRGATGWRGAWAEGAMLPCLIDPAAEICVSRLRQSVVHTACGSKSGTSPGEWDSPLLPLRGIVQKEEAETEQEPTRQCFSPLIDLAADCSRGTWP